MADWNYDGVQDLVGIKKAATGTASTEVHVVSGRANFREFLLQTGTALHETDGTWSFSLSHWDDIPYPPRAQPLGNGYDLVGIKKSGAPTAEVHILNP